MQVSGAITLRFRELYHNLRPAVFKSTNYGVLVVRALRDTSRFVLNSDGACHNQAQKTAIRRPNFPANSELAVLGVELSRVL